MARWRLLAGKIDPVALFGGDQAAQLERSFKAMTPPSKPTRMEKGPVMSWEENALRRYFMDLPLGGLHPLDGLPEPRRQDRGGFL
jgi:hypothetical protein